MPNPTDNLMLIPRAYSEIEIGRRALAFMLCLYAMEGDDGFACGNETIVIYAADWEEWAERVGCSVRTLHLDLRAAKRAGLVRYTVNRTGDWVFDGSAPIDDEMEKPEPVAA
jgi:hypothetical protein